MKLLVTLQIREGIIEDIFQVRIIFCKNEIYHFLNNDTLEYLMLGKLKLSSKNFEEFDNFLEYTQYTLLEISILNFHYV